MTMTISGKTWAMAISGKTWTMTISVKTWTMTISGKTWTMTISNQNTQEVKNECFLISTRQNNVRIFGIRCLRQSDKQANRYNTQNGENT